ncbi:hypothetical protein [Devosia sp. CN2-171]|uniref:hypothetical protein n=1 Tax=Devosia sp. CN2-171 TaxID=3400909 RepID=UPI003BF7E2E0
MKAVSTKAGRKTTVRPTHIFAALAAASLLILSGSASSQTITPQSVDPWQHFIDCAGVLISAPDIHAQYCLPSNNPPETKSLMPTGDGGDCMTVVDDTADAFDVSKDPCFGQDDDVQIPG